MLSLAPRMGGSSGGSIGAAAGGSSSGSSGGAGGSSARQEELVEALANDLLDQVGSGTSAICRVEGSSGSSKP